MCDADCFKLTKLSAFIRTQEDTSNQKMENALARITLILMSEAFLANEAYQLYIEYYRQIYCNGVLMNVTCEE